MSRSARPWFMRMAQQTFRLDLPRSHVIASSDKGQGVSKSTPSLPKVKKNFVVGKSIVGEGDVVL